MNKHHWLQLFADDGGEAPAQAPEEAPGTAAEASPAARHWQQVEEIYERMMQQAETLREVFPDFDLRQELQNQTFAQALGCGMTPEQVRDNAGALRIQLNGADAVRMKWDVDAIS